MKSFFISTLLIIAIALAYSCANQGSPTGGPKDTIPPTLLNSYPTHKSINYTGQEFKLSFDERINTDKLKQNLIITPIIENPYDIKFKKYDVILKFENPFDSATTYTLNFGEGITDVTEKNPVENLTLAFSTGSIIDSISISGQVLDLYTNKENEKYIVALYAEDDTLNILTGKPRYFAKTDKEGNFFIENIKNGFYRVYAFDDQNNNMVCDPKDEAHGLLSKSVDLNQNQENIVIRTLLLDVSPLEFSRGKTTGIYYDLAYNKYIKEYRLEEYHNPSKLPIPKNNLFAENTLIRFYYDSAYQYQNDSIGFRVHSMDSIGNESVDTAFVQFRESKRKPFAFEQKVTPRSVKLEDKLKLNLFVNKPITHYDLDSFMIQYDTLINQKIPDSLYYWNERRTVLTYETDLDSKFFKKHVDSLLTNYSDTTIKDSLYIAARQYLNRIDTNKFKIYLAKNSLISVENDSSKMISIGYSFVDPSNTGTVSGNINTSYTSYIIQLVTPSYSVVKSQKDGSTFNFVNVAPGKYTLRVLIDTNNDGKWSYGNILVNEEPESIYFYEEEFDVRANWQLENVNIQF